MRVTSRGALARRVKLHQKNIHVYSNYKLTIISLTFNVKFWHLVKFVGSFFYAGTCTN